MSDETLSKIQQIVADQLGIEAEKVVPESNFTKELGADSLDVVELVMAFEEAFEIDIDESQPLDFEVQMMVSTNFRWKSYCNYIGLNSDNVFQLLEDVKTLMKIASILLISTII